MRNLFQIEEHLYNLIEELYAHEDVGADIPDELISSLEIVQEELENKCKAYYHVISELTGDIGTIDNEIERLQAIKVSKGNTIDRLKNQIHQAVLKFGDTGKTGNKTMKFDTLNMWTVNTKPLVILDELEVADEYRDYLVKVPKLTKVQAEQLAQYMSDGLELISPDKVSDIIDSTINKVKIKDAIKQGTFEETEDIYIDTQASYLRIQEPKKK